MITVGFFNDDEFRSSEAMRAIQKMVQKSVGPAREHIREFQAVSMTKVMENLQPTLAVATANASRALSEIIVPDIEVPAFDLNLKTLRQISLGDEAAQRSASSIDYMDVARRVAIEIEEAAPQTPVDLEREAITEQQLDEMTANLFERHPDIAAKFYNDPHITTLNPSQKKMFAWQWTLTIVFIMGLLFAWGQVDNNAEYVLDMTTTTLPIAAAGYLSATKTLKANEDDEGERPEDEREGA